MGRSLVFFLSAVFFTLCCAPASFAADPGPAKPLADNPEQIKVDRTTAVSVEHEGTDTLGAKLAFQLKGVFNASSLFSLTEKDVPKLKVVITTAAEFPSRPYVASVYSVVWAFSQTEGTLNFMLAREVGVLGAEDLDSVVAKIAERTDGIAAKYGYLFKK